MSYNRKTKAYRLRVKRLASHLIYPGWNEKADREMTVDETFAAREPSAPRYLFEDAVRHAIEACRSSEESYRLSSEEYHERAENFETHLQGIKRPALRIVMGAA